MSIKNEILRIKNNIANAYEAAAAKGATNLYPKNSANLANAIQSIVAQASSEELIVDNVVFNQTNSVVETFLRDVAYDPSDYDTSSIVSYANMTGKSDKPNTTIITLSSAGDLVLCDYGTNKIMIESVNSGNYTIQNIAPTAKGGSYLLLNNNEVVQFGLIHPSGMLRAINAGGRNMRDLGGWNCDGGTVKYGLIFRGSLLESQPVENTKVLVNQLGVKHDFDLRAFETNLTTSPLGNSVTFHKYDNYLWYSGSNQKLLKQILDDIIAAVRRDEPIYFHCAAGADRTGTIAFFLENLLGMNQSDIDKDYELTTFYTGTANVSEQRRRDENDWKNLVAEFDDYAGETLSERVINFLFKIGMKADDLNTFRTKMIDGTPTVLTNPYNTVTITSNASPYYTNTNSTISDYQYQPYTAEIIPASGRVISNVQIMMGEEDITGRCFSGDFIPNGNQTITTNGSYKIKKYYGVNINVPQGTNITEYSITSNLSHATLTNSQNTSYENQGYNTIICPSEGYKISSVQVLMGQQNITNDSFIGFEDNNYYTNNSYLNPSPTPEEPTITNLYNTNNITLNCYIESSGALTQSADGNGCYVTDYIPCDCSSGIQTLKIEGLKANELPSFGTRINYYDESHTKLNENQIRVANIYTTKTENNITYIDTVPIGKIDNGTTATYLNDIQYVQFVIKIQNKTAGALTSNDVLSTDDLKIYIAN